MMMVPFLQVLEEVGQFVLSSCFSGYNSCLFSYGACGSGKTHIMFGTDKSQGLMSWICENLFKRASCYDDDTSFRAEIRYNFSFTFIRGLLYLHGLEKNLLNFLLWESPYISGYVPSPFIGKRGFLLRNVCIYHHSDIMIFFVDWFHSPYTSVFCKKMISIEHCTVTRSSYLGCKCTKGTGIQIYIASLRKTRHEEIGIFAYSLLGFVRKVYILDDYKFTKSKHPGVWHQGRKHIKNGNFFATVSPDG